MKAQIFNIQLLARLAIEGNNTGHEQDCFMDAATGFQDLWINVKYKVTFRSISEVHVCLGSLKCPPVALWLCMNTNIRTTIKIGAKLCSSCSFSPSTGNKQPTETNLLPIARSIYLITKVSVVSTLVIEGRNYVFILPIYKHQNHFRCL